MKRLLIVSCMVFVFMPNQAQKHIGNPIIKHIFTADPSVLVYNDTLFLFTGHDEQDTLNDFFLMHDWHVFSTDNMYDYTDHGALLSVKDFDWAKANAFASHAIEKDGKFWWYVSLTHKDIKVKEGFAIGVAVADHPLGPYKDAKGAPIVSDNTKNCVPLNIDPAVYIDDDGKVYLTWGSWGQARIVELEQNMIDMKGEVETLNLKNFFEAPFIHKYKDTYYLTYSGSGYPSKIEYCTSDNINGPWTYQGVINGLMPVSATNHQAIVDYKGEWYFVYHSSALPDGGVFRRSVCIDKLEYTKDGKIKPIVRTKTSVPALKKKKK